MEGRSIVRSTRFEKRHDRRTLVGLGSNPDSGSDRHQRYSDDEQVDREPSRKSGHSLVLHDSYFVPEEGGANVNQFTLDTKF